MAGTPRERRDMPAQRFHEVFSPLAIWQGDLLFYYLKCQHGTWSRGLNWRGGPRETLEVKNSAHERKEDKCGMRHVKDRTDKSPDKCVMDPNCLTNKIKAQGCEPVLKVIDRISGHTCKLVEAGHNRVDRLVNKTRPLPEACGDKLKEKLFSRLTRIFSFLLQYYRAPNPPHYFFKCASDWVGAT